MLLADEPGVFTAKVATVLNLIDFAPLQIPAPAVPTSPRAVLINCSGPAISWRRHFRSTWLGVLSDRSEQTTDKCYDLFIFLTICSFTSLP